MIEFSYMNTSSFWSIVGLLEGGGIAKIKSKLLSLDKKDLVGFHDVLSGLLAESCTFPLLAANFVIESYVSDDGFKIFRAWLVLQGRDKFLAAVEDPESIRNWLDRDEIDEIEEGDRLLSLASEIYGDGDFFEKIADVSDPILVQEWPMDKREYRSRWPRLVDKFWNPKLIDEMHG